MDSATRFVHGGGDAARGVIDEWRANGDDGPLTVYIVKMANGDDLDRDETDDAMNVIMNGRSDELGMAAFLATLGTKGITATELVSMAGSMRRYASVIAPDTSGFDGLLTDTCGTGGDVSGTFNISTAAAFVVAAANVPVAKHGNRSVTSSCGSADVLESLDAVIDLEPHAVRACIETVGIGFLFARRFHASMRHVAGARSRLATYGLKSAFNLLGPLTNPAGVKAQLLGVFDGGLTDMFATALAELGCDRALCVHGTDETGTVRYDEISISGPTRVSELEDGAVRTYDIEPSSLGLDCETGMSLTGGDSPEHGALVLRKVLAGDCQPAYRAMTLANAGAAIYVGLPTVESVTDGISRAAHAIDSGAALDKLDAFVDATRRMGE